MFLMEHRGRICTWIQSDQPGWEDHLSSALEHVINLPGYRVEDRREPDSVPQLAQDTVDQHPQAQPYKYMRVD